MEASCSSGRELLHLCADVWCTSSLSLISWQSKYTRPYFTHKSARENNRGKYLYTGSRREMRFFKTKTNIGHNCLKRHEVNNHRQTTAEWAWEDCRCQTTQQSLVCLFTKMLYLSRFSGCHFLADCGLRYLMWQKCHFFSWFVSCCLFFPFSTVMFHWNNHNEGLGSCRACIYWSSRAWGHFTAVRAILLL